jgi:hypothetical protein
VTRKRTDCVAKSRTAAENFYNVTIKPLTKAVQSTDYLNIYKKDWDNNSTLIHLFKAVKYSEANSTPKIHNLHSTWYLQSLHYMLTQSSSELTIVNFIKLALNLSVTERSYILYLIFAMFQLVSVIVE